MSELVRFGVAMDRGLLSEFDRRIAARGYENRSEALRDLIRADLTRAAWEAGARVAATLTVVFSPEVREALLRLTDMERSRPPVVVSSLLVQLDPARWLQVSVLRGQASDLSALAGQVGGLKGVLSCDLTVAAPLSPSDATPHPHPEEPR